MLEVGGHWELRGVIESQVAVWHGAYLRKLALVLEVLLHVPVLKASFLGLVRTSGDLSDHGVGTSLIAGLVLFLVDLWDLILEEFVNCRLISLFLDHFLVLVRRNMFRI